MILGDPALQAVRDRFRMEGCPECGERSADIQVIGYEEIILECGHLLDVPRWLEADDLSGAKL